MKNLITHSICSFLAFCLFMSFTNPAPNNISESKNSITVTVKSSSGSAQKVVADVCGGISCIGQTKAVYTDKYGSATVSFSDGCRLCNIYLDGKSNKGTYKDGESYTF